MSSQRILISVLFALGISAGSAVGAFQAREIPQSIGDLNAAQLVEVRDLAGAVLLHGTFKTESTKANEIKREADLVSPSGAKGKGELEVEMARKEKHGAVETKDEIALEVKHLPEGVQCELFIDGQRVAAFVTLKSGKAEVELKRKSVGW